jgi:hypothetical protein
MLNNDEREVPGCRHRVEEELQCFQAARGGTDPDDSQGTVRVKVLHDGLLRLDWTVARIVLRTNGLLM